MFHFSIAHAHARLQSESLQSTPLCTIPPGQICKTIFGNAPPANMDIKFGQSVQSNNINVIILWLYIIQTQV